MTPKSSIVSPSIQNPKLQKPTSNPFKLLSNPTPPKAYCFLWRRQDRRRLLLASLRSAQRRRDWSVARELRAYGFDGFRGSGLSKWFRGVGFGGGAAFPNIWSRAVDFPRRAIALRENQVATRALHQRLRIPSNFRCCIWQKRAQQTPNAY